MNKSKIKTYLVSDMATNLIKIGRAEKPKERLVSLQCGSSTKLNIAHVFDANIERELHVYFHDKRKHGEWFDVSPSDVILYVEKNLNLSNFQVSKDTKNHTQYCLDNDVTDKTISYFEKLEGKFDENGFECKWLNDQNRYSDYGQPYYERSDNKDDKIRKEYDMINVIVFGKTSSMLRVSFNTDDYDDLGPSLPPMHFESMRDLQRANTVYIEDGIDFKERKIKLQSLFDRKFKEKLIQETHLINA